MASEPTYDLKSGKPHPYHLVSPSIWPLASSFAAGLLALGTVLFMHDVQWKWIHFGVKGTILGFLCVLAVMWFWWRDVIKEAVVEKAHSAETKVGFRYGMALFIASEAMFFVAFFWAFFNAALMPTAAIGHVWPPANITVFDPFHLPFLMTLVLLLSGCSCTWAHYEILNNNQKEATKALAITVGLGVIFTFLQAYEYSHASFGFKDGIYSSVFYMATGFHGFHVLIGTIFLAVCLFRNMKGHFTRESHFGFEAAAWYWHFVDIVWLFLFVAVYWWGGT
jgi:cytochrome c oxidase subunit 3